MKKNNATLFENLKLELDKELNSIKKENKKYSLNDKKVSFSSLSTYRNDTLKISKKKKQKPLIKFEFEFHYNFKGLILIKMKKKET